MTDFGWGGWVNGSLTNNGNPSYDHIISDYDLLIDWLVSNGWNAIRPQSQRPWQSSSARYPNIAFDRPEIMDYMIDKAEANGVTVYLCPFFYGSPTDIFNQGGNRLPAIIDGWLQLNSRYNNRENVVFEIINEYDCPNTTQGFNNFQAVLDALRNAGCERKLLFNYSQWGQYQSCSRTLNDPLDNYMIGHHAYGHNYANAQPTRPHHTDLDSYARQAGVTGNLEQLFASGCIGQALANNVEFAVTELGCDWTASGMCRPGGYLMNAGNMAYVMKFLDFARLYDVNVIMHRISEFDDRRCYYGYALEYFNQPFWQGEITPPPPPPPPTPPQRCALHITAWHCNTSPNAGSHVYDRGTTVQITATPHLGYKFDHWEVNMQTMPETGTSLSVLVDADKIVYAICVPIEEPPAEPPAEAGCITAFLLTSMGLSTWLPLIRQLRSHLPNITVIQRVI